MRPSLIPLLLWLMVPPGVRGAAPPVAMTVEAIAEAIALGQQAAPRPYVLRPWIGDPGVLSASVYTPFIRVALASHMATLEGRTLSPSSIDRGLDGANQEPGEVRAACAAHGADRPHVGARAAEPSNRPHLHAP